MNSRIWKVAVCGFEVGKLKAFWKYCTKPNHIIQYSDIYNICEKDVSSYKLKEKNTRDVFNLKI